MNPEQNQSHPFKGCEDNRVKTKKNYILIMVKTAILKKELIVYTSQIYCRVFVS